MSTMTRRDVLHHVSALLGGVALIGGDSLAAFTFDEAARSQAMSQGIGAFSAADIALLDEIAETILPETSTPGAKAAKTGAFIALMVTDTYTDRQQDAFTSGLRQINEASTRAHGVNFMDATPEQRLAVAQQLDREQKDTMDARQAPPVNRAPITRIANDEPAHYFRMLKELTLLGFFTSEIGMTKALRYVENPGRYNPCAPHAPGDRAWAAHA
jgi:hypothetical protein